MSRTVANTGMAVMIDGGEFDNIHPGDKRTVGHRLALQARCRGYGEDVVCEGPRLCGMRRRGERLELRFSGGAGKLEVRGERLEGFELAGADGVYCSAREALTEDGVTLWAEEVQEPVMVRYAWTNYGPANLYNAAGLPAAPFRTDREEFD